MQLLQKNKKKKKEKTTGPPPYSSHLCRRCHRRGTFHTLGQLKSKNQRQNTVMKHAFQSREISMQSSASELEFYCPCRQNPSFASYSYPNGCLLSVPYPVSAASTDGDTLNALFLCRKIWKERYNQWVHILSD